ncbi:vitelline membrane outer layer protein 1-like [Sinocyclocheilus grahami]|uniref:vitelline membrane outer layer protein 1-like n=1 Tax=Sinocyclocheilus grahami TaxID=75366 RepID=UPI0007ACC0AF|nr:PREDICTED: vitelline membrane outer layer protein 1-like [Sinocyclocheilus grahami]
MLAFVGLQFHQLETEELDLGSGESCDLIALASAAAMHHLLFVLLVINGLHVSVQTAGRRSARSVNRYYRSRLTVSNGMNWGLWGFKDMCPSGMYAAGFSLKVDEPSYGFWDDNKGLTGIRLHCISPLRASLGLYEDYASVQSEVGGWGQWTEIKWCPCCFLTAFQLRVESFQGIGDDTAANNIRFKCSGGSLLHGDGTSWGEWGGWGPTCQGKAICGIKTRIEEPQGSGDNTALNDARMYCCD